jgi:hypothetical protein
MHPAVSLAGQALARTKAAARLPHSIACRPSRSGRRGERTSNLQSPRALNMPRQRLRRYSG